MKSAGVDQADTAGGCWDRPASAPRGCRAAAGDALRRRRPCVSVSSLGAGQVQVAHVRRVDLAAAVAGEDGQHAGLAHGSDGGAVVEDVVGVRHPDGVGPAVARRAASGTRTRRSRRRTRQFPPGLPRNASQMLPWPSQAQRGYVGAMLVTGVRLACRIGSLPAPARRCRRASASRPSRPRRRRPLTAGAAHFHAQRAARLIQRNALLLQRAEVLAPLIAAVFVGDPEPAVAS